LVVSAFAHQHKHSFSERILRYPDGRERRIIYPIDDVSAAKSEDDIVISGDIYRSFAEELQPDRWTSSPEELDVSGLWSGALDEPWATAASSSAAPADVAPQQQVPEQQQDLFEELNSTSYRDAQRQHWERIGSSYQVLHGCPWLLPKALHVLAVPQVAHPHAALFTLQTRVQQPHVESEMDKVLGRRHADGSSIFTVDSLVEGIVAFEDEAMAEAFGHALEAEGHQDVSLATADSHELFRLSTSSAAVVVLMKPQSAMPMPGELEASLRQQRRVADVM
jgi:hypothetical protein